MDDEIRPPPGSVTPSVPAAAAWEAVFPLLPAFGNQYAIFRFVYSGKLTSCEVMSDPAGLPVIAHPDIILGAFDAVDSGIQVTVLVWTVEPTFFVSLDGTEVANQTVRSWSYMNHQPSPVTGLELSREFVSGVIGQERWLPLAGVRYRTGWQITGQPGGN